MTISSETKQLATKELTFLETGDEQKVLKIEDFGPTDGGLKAWSTVLGCTLVAFATFGFVNGFGVFVDYYQEVYLSDYSPTVITLIGAVQVFMLYILAGFSGAVFDAIGPRILIPASGVIVVFSLFMLSLTRPQQIYQQYLTQGILFNLGASSSFFPALAMIPHWFKYRVAYAIGFVTAGASVGGIVFPIMLNHILPKLGWGWSIRICAFMVMGCFIIASVTIIPRRPTKPLPPFKTLLAFEALKDPCYLFLAFGSWLSIFSIFNPFFYVGLYGTVVNGESSLTPYYLPILCATSIAGRVLPGLVADKFGRFNVLCIATLTSAILILAMWYNVTSQSAVAAFAGLYGFTSGPFFSLLPSCIASIRPIERVGASVGFMFAFMSSGALAGTPIGGVFIEDNTLDNFKRLILFSGLMGLAGSLFLFVARFIKERKVFVIV